MIKEVRITTVEELMPVSVVPEPDNMMRVYMMFAPCDAETEGAVMPQELPVFCREGFSVLEWGGTELKRID